MVGKFLLGVVTGGLMVTGGLVLGSLLYPTRPANDNIPAAATEAPIAAPEATTPEAGETAAIPEPADTTAAAPEAAAASTDALAPEPEPAMEEAKAEILAEAPAVSIADTAPPAPETVSDSDTAAGPDAPSAEIAKPDTEAEPSKPDAPVADAAATPEATKPAEAAQAVEPAATEPEPIVEAPVLAPETAAADPAPVEPASADLAPVEPATSETATAAPAPVEPAAEPAAPDTELAETPVEPPVEAAAPETAPAPTNESAAVVTEPTLDAATTMLAETEAAASETVPETAAAETGVLETPPAEAPATEPAPTETPATQAPATELPATESPIAPLPEVAPLPETAPAAEVVVEAAPEAEVPAMPGDKPAALPGTAEPEADGATTAEAPGNSPTFKPAPGLVRSGEGLIIGRDKPAEPSPADPAATPDDPRPIAQFAAAFENPDAKPPFAIVLVDPGTPDLDRAGLAALPFPVSFALDPLDPATPERAALYRAAGKEVVMLVTGIAEGAQASDVEVAFQSMEQGLTEAVAVMDLAAPTFQNNRGLAGAVVPILKAEGRGLLTWDEGLNAADQIARREDLEAAVVFRNLDQGNGDKVAVRRLLDRAVFKADQVGRVSVVGTADPAMVAALLEWTVEGKAATVALAPLTAVLKVD